MYWFIILYHDHTIAGLSALEFREAAPAFHWPPTVKWRDEHMANLEVMKCQDLPINYRGKRPKTVWGEWEDKVT